MGRGSRRPAFVAGALAVAAAAVAALTAPAFAMPAAQAAQAPQTAGARQSAQAAQAPQATGARQSAQAAQAPQTASVTGVASGDTLTARTSDGRELTVRLIGIDAPPAMSCAGEDARDALVELTRGQTVTLTADPSVEPVDEFGRSWLYVDRGDGLDVGAALIERGWATVVDTPRFARLRAYRDAEDVATESGAGVWTACDGDFDFSRADEQRALRESAEAFVRRYYRHLSANRFRAAWRMLGPPARRKLGNRYGAWRASHRGSLGIAVRSSRARLEGRRAIVTVRLRSRDRDACSRRIVRQHFRGAVTVETRGRTQRIVVFDIDKTRGATPRLSKSQCPAPKPRGPRPGPSPNTPPPPTTDCQGYDPCLPPGPDVDCAGGSGNGPRYTGPVRVTGSDPYGLDSDGDGWGCES